MKGFVLSYEEMENPQKNGVRKSFMGLMIFCFLFFISGNLFAQTTVKELSFVFGANDSSDFVKTVKGDSGYVLLYLKNTANLAIISKTGSNEEVRSFFRQLTQLINAGERQKQRLEELVKPFKVWVASPSTTLEGKPVYEIKDDAYNLTADVFSEFPVFALIGFSKVHSADGMSLYNSSLLVTNAEQLPLFESNLKKALPQMKQ